MLTRQRINPASLTCNAGALGEPVRADDEELTYVYHEFRRDQITGASRTACAPAKPVCAAMVADKTRFTRYRHFEPLSSALVRQEY